MTITALKEAKEEKCEVAVGVPITGGEPALESKQDYIARILAERNVEGHLLQLQANYIVCQKCGVRALRNAARQKIQSLHESACWYGPWTPGQHWHGSPAHILWRRGHKVYCQTCKSHSIYKDEAWRASRQLQKPCTADAKKHTQLPLRFRAKGPSEDAW